MESLRYLISEWLEAKLPFLVEREVEIEEIPKDVVFVITGARRSGKTYFLYEIVKN